MLYNYLIMNDRVSKEIPTWEGRENYNYCEDIHEVISNRGLFSSFFSNFKR